MAVIFVEELPLIPSRLGVWAGVISGRDMQAKRGKAISLAQLFLWGLMANACLSMPVPDTSSCLNDEYYPVALKLRARIDQQVQLLKELPQFGDSFLAASMDLFWTRTARTDLTEAILPVLSASDARHLLMSLQL